MHRVRGGVFAPCLWLLEDSVSTGGGDPMRTFVHKHSGTLFLLALVLALVLAVVAPSTASVAAAESPPPTPIDQLYNVVNPEVSGANAFANVAYVWRGWRNAGGPWFNQVMGWIGDQLATDGFVSGKTPADPTAAHYWTQMDYRTGSVWVPQYLSMQIVGPEGDAVAGDLAAYHFDHPEVNTFDPMSPYYPAYMDQDWILSHVGTPEEAAIQDRCHLATSSAFTAPLDTPVAIAETAAGGAITADVVDVGTVSSSGTRTWSKHSGTSLTGKILFSATASMSNLMTLASQQSAKAVMTPMALGAYSDPIINGVELYPNNVRFASGGSSAAPTRISLNISNQDARFLTALCAQYDQTSGFPQMKLFAIGGSKPYSASPATDTMLPTVIAEIPGTDPNPAIANQRVVYGAHVQEPGACDNATGVGTLLEMVRTVKHLIDTGVIAPPKRTLTFLWGNETIMGTLWKGQNPDAFESTQIFIDLDMTGEDPTKTGGPMRIEKMPDPSAQYKYQLDRLPADPVPTPTQFLRQPDSHTLWGAGSVKYWPFPGHFLNDTYFFAANKVKSGSPAFSLLGNPWEGGSDHDTFLWNKDAAGNWDTKPAVLTWHFTDYVYHSSMDTMDTVSAREMHDVAVTSILAGWDVVDASVESADQDLTILTDAATARFGLEKANTNEHFFWALTHAYGSPATIDGALHEALTGTGNTSTRSIGENQILSEWGNWYKQAVQSVRSIFDPADGTPAYTSHEASALAGLTAETNDALAYANHLFVQSHFGASSIVINGGAATTNARNVTLALNAASFAPGGVTGMRLSEDGKTWPVTFSPYVTRLAYVLPAGDGAKTLYVQFQDAEGNVADAVSDSIALDTSSADTTKPTVSDNSPATWSKAAVTVGLSASDSGGSGLAKTQYRLQGSGPWLDAAGDQFTVAAPADHSFDGAHVYEYQAVDNAGNLSGLGTCTVRIDTTNPVTTATGLQGAAGTGWIKAAQTVTLTGADTGGSGVFHTYYTVDGGAAQTYSGAFSVSGEASHVITYWSVDNSVSGGNAEAVHTGYVNVDLSVPTVGNDAPTGWRNVPVTVTLTPADTGGSGVQKTQYRLQGSGTWLDATANQFTVSATANDGAHVYEYQALDNAGNASTLGTCTVNIDASLPTVGDSAAATWSKSAVTVTLTPADTGGSGVLKTQYRAQGAAMWTDAASNKFIVSATANDGAHIYEYQALDNAGNTSVLGSCTVRIDATSPVTTAGGLQSAATSGWTNTAQTVILQATDGGSGVAATYYTVDGGAQQTYSAPFAVSGAASHTVVYWSADSAVTGGNTEAMHTGYVNIDAAAPTVGAAVAATWSNVPVTVTLTPADNGGSGLQKTQYRAQGASIWLDAAGDTFEAAAPADHSNDGARVYEYQALDNAGNTSVLGSCTVRIDTAAPATVASGLAADAGSGWTSGPVSFTILGSDPASGVSITSFTIDGGPAQLYLGVPVTVSSEGSHAVRYWSTDAAGNIETARTGYANIDKTAPVTEATGLQASATSGWRNSAQTVTLSGADAARGPARAAGSPVSIHYTIDGGAAQSYAAPFAIKGAGSHAVTYWSTDAAGNAEAAHAGYVNIDTGKPTASALADVSVKAGKTATLRCKLADPAPSCGSGSLTITLARSGKVVKTLRFSAIKLSGTQSFAFKVTLKKGTYTWTARATDAAGNVQAQGSVKKLTVK
jgi:hypothetical protein